MVSDDQWFGLNERGLDKVSDAIGSFEYEPIRGVFRPVVEWLHIFRFSDGTVLLEHIQDVLWKDGPYYFTALKTFKGNWIKGTLWDEEEMNDA